MAPLLLIIECQRLHEKIRTSSKGRAVFAPRVPEVRNVREAVIVYFRLSSDGFTIKS